MKGHDADDDEMPLANTTTTTTATAPTLACSTEDHNMEQDFEQLDKPDQTNEARDDEGSILAFIY